MALSSHTDSRIRTIQGRTGTMLLNAMHASILFPFYLLLLCPIASAQTAEEDLLFKAAYIYNFAKFTTWPNDQWNSTTPYVNLCATGKNPLTGKLKNLHGKPIQGRTLSVIIIKQNNIPDNCHLLYIGHDNYRQLVKTLAETSNKPILTISEFPSFTKMGGMIELNRTAGITKLYINLSAVEHSRLKLSSRLLIMAEIQQQDDK